MFGGLQAALRAAMLIQRNKMAREGQAAADDSLQATPHVKQKQKQLLEQGRSPQDGRQGAAVTGGGGAKRATGLEPAGIKQDTRQVGAAAGEKQAVAAAERNEASVANVGARKLNRVPQVPDEQQPFGAHRGGHEEDAVPRPPNGHLGLQGGVGLQGSRGKHDANLGQRGAMGHELGALKTKLTQMRSPRGQVDGPRAADEARATCDDAVGSEAKRKVFGHFQRSAVPINAGASALDEDASLKAAVPASSFGRVTEQLASMAPLQKNFAPQEKGRQAQAIPQGLIRTDVYAHGNADPLTQAKPAKLQAQMHMLDAQHREHLNGSHTSAANPSRAICRDADTRSAPEKAYGLNFLPESALDAPTAHTPAPKRSADPYGTERAMADLMQSLLSDGSRPVAGNQPLSKPLDKAHVHGPVYGAHMQAQEHSDTGTQAANGKQHVQQARAQSPGSYVPAWHGDVKGGVNGYGQGAASWYAPAAHGAQSPRASHKRHDPKGSDSMCLQKQSAHAWTGRDAYATTGYVDADEFTDVGEDMHAAHADQSVAYQSVPVATDSDGAIHKTTTEDEWLLAAFEVTEMARATAQQVRLTLMPHAALYVCMDAALVHVCMDASAHQI